MNAVETSPSVRYGRPPAESSTSGADQNRIAFLLRDEEQSSTALLREPQVRRSVPERRFFIDGGAVLFPARAGQVYGNASTGRVFAIPTVIHEFAEKEVTLASLYAPNVAASIVARNYPQEIFVMPETQQFDLIYSVPNPNQVHANPLAEDDVNEMVWSSESIFRVSAQMFKDVRPLTDRERQHLRKFYRRAYKAR